MHSEINPPSMTEYDEDDAPALDAGKRHALRLFVLLIALIVIALLVVFVLLPAVDQWLKPPTPALPAPIRL